MSLGQDMVTALRKTQQPWLSKQDEDSQNSSMNGDVVHEVVELLAVDGCQGKESNFTLGVWPLVGYQCSIGWLHTHLFVNTNWTWLVI